MDPPTQARVAMNGRPLPMVSLVVSRVERTSEPRSVIRSSVSPSKNHEAQPVRSELAKIVASARVLLAFRIVGVLVSADCLRETPATHDSGEFERQTGTALSVRQRTLPQRYETYRETRYCRRVANHHLLPWVAKQGHSPRCGSTGPTLLSGARLY